jgi:ppGpp synthetase/RelA/SpoT-type nucleotidyltranferase
MALALSKSQIERLGVRLIAQAEPTDADIDLLHQLLGDYEALLDRAVALVRDAADVSPTSRVKNTGTILENLHRHGGSWLKSMQDIAGMRIVDAGGRADQDRLVARLVAAFDLEPRRPKVVDRRADPTHGYRAVHVIVFPDGVPVEIQVRTQLQHEWADMFEKLADRAGREIRYGDPPQHWRTEAQREAYPAVLLDLYRSAYRLRETTVALALVHAD